MKEDYILKVIRVLFLILLTVIIFEKCTYKCEDKGEAENLIQSRQH